MRHILTFGLLCALTTSLATEAHAEPERELDASRPANVPPSKLDSGSADDATSERSPRTRPTPPAKPIEPSSGHERPRHDASSGRDEIDRGNTTQPYDPIDPEDGISDWDHLEFSMGFLGGQRSYDRTNFEHDDGGGSIPGAKALVEPFERAPFDTLNVVGLRYDVRLVVSYVRMTAGVDIPFAVYRARDATRTYDVGGVQRTVSIDSIQPVGLRFGIGGELPIGPVAPFVDVLGAVHWTDAVLRIDDSEVTYKATSFNLSARGGARLHVRRWFFASLAGEVGIVGDVRWGAELAVGFAAM